VFSSKTGSKVILLIHLNDVVGSNRARFDLELRAHLGEVFATS